MTTSLKTIRQSLRKLLVRNASARRRPVSAAPSGEILETRRLLSAKRSYETVHGAGHDHHDHDLEVDGFPLPTTTPSGGSGPSAAAPFGLDQTFQLSSRASSTKTIFLDFNGHTTSGTWWNSVFNGGAAFTTPAFSTDGSAAFSDAELERIQLIWQRVAEDFAPFDVNVTTQDPGAAAIVNSGGGDVNWGVRVVIGGSYADWYESSAGGVAYLNTFGDSMDMGVFVFSQNLSNAEKYVAEAISHEVGHALGLGHDGASGTGYYSGHGSGATGWAPIMGVGYYRELTQWSRGEYNTANNTQDDLSIITTNNGFTYRADDYGSTRGTASVLATTTSGGIKTVDVAGVIERNTDQDWLSFTTTGGAVSLNFTGAARGGNLDIAASLYDSSGQLLQTSNPADLTTASLTASLAAGTYYVMVDGVGARGLSDGYSDYGSLGQYFIAGTIADDGSGGGGDEDDDDDGPPAGTSVITGRIWHDSDADGRIDVGDAGIVGVTVYLDTNNNGAFDAGTEQSATTGVDGRYTFSGLAAGAYRVRQIASGGFAQVYPKANAARSVTVGAGRTISNIDFRSLRPPVIGNLGASVGYTARAAAVVLASTGTLTDADTAIFKSFKLTAQITSGGHTSDRLAIRNQGKGVGQVGVSSSAVTYSGVRVASVSGGSGSGPLTITFNASATAAAVQAVLQNITYRSLATSPPLTARTVQFVMIEANGTIGVPASKSILLSAAASA